ncbi:hypothetical protein L2E82_43852 [Cichorium intybus]|uniref:Uncharacterized protein n=1 Tax=Cichorium intybus TaxID=13427 RepID=A0ACB8ZPK2_CICIN|nr:hypothetical protein L2E82_43852 [Cichorium intybus]
MRVFTSLLPNQFTVPIVVSACAELGDLVLGMIVHGLVLKDGTFQETSAVGSSFVTLEGGFQACGDLDSVYSGRCLHGVALKSGLTCSIALQSSIFSMYSKCGTLEEAYMSFSEVPVKDIKLWTSIINVYGKLGNIKQCLSGFIEMLISGKNPDPMVPCIEREEFSRPMIKIPSRKPGSRRGGGAAYCGGAITGGP